MCYQDFKDTFVCNTQPDIRITNLESVVLSGFQRYFCMQYTTRMPYIKTLLSLCYQDFKDTFVCNTQQKEESFFIPYGCVIRISKILLYAIHNHDFIHIHCNVVVLSGFQRYFCMQYTTLEESTTKDSTLCYQDFKDTFVCNTQHLTDKQKNAYGCVIRISKILLYAIHNGYGRALYYSAVVLSGFQRYFCMQYTTLQLFIRHLIRCVIRISKILLYAIHNRWYRQA